MKGILCARNRCRRRADRLGVGWPPVYYVDAAAPLRPVRRTSQGLIAVRVSWILPCGIPVYRLTHGGITRNPAGACTEHLPAQGLFL